MSSIQVTVSPTGESTVTTTGFEGSACRTASEFLERALGQPETEHLTAAFHLTETAQRSVEATHQ